MKQNLGVLAVDVSPTVRQGNCSLSFAEELLESHQTASFQWRWDRSMPGFIHFYHRFPLRVCQQTQSLKRTYVKEERQTEAGKGWISLAQCWPNCTVDIPRLKSQCVVMLGNIQLPCSSVGWLAQTLWNLHPSYTPLFTGTGAMTANI